MNKVSDSEARRKFGCRALLALGLTILMSGVSERAAALTSGDRYEMVSPELKAGYGVQDIDGVSSDGGRVAFFSRGAFAHTPAGPAPADYLSSRGAPVWSTTPLLPPAGLVASEAAYDLAPTLDETLLLGIPGLNYGALQDESREDEFLAHVTANPDTDAYWEVVGGIALKTLEEQRLQVVEVGASPKFCHVVLEQGIPLLAFPGIYTEVAELYDLSRGCGATTPSLRLVGVDNDPAGGLIDPLCAVELGTGPAGAYGDSGKGSAFNAVAASGEAVLFTAGVEESVRSKETCPDHQLFVRLGGVRTVEVSRVPEVGKLFGGCVSEGGVAGEVPCVGARSRAAANFVGASEDGTLVYFTSGSPADLFLARLGCSGGGSGCAVVDREVLSVSRVSVGVGGGGGLGGVQGVVRVAPDGSRVYYVATGVLSDAPDGEGFLPAQGGDNLYVYDAGTGETRFVSELCSGPGESGGIVDARCPAGGAVSDERLWSKAGDFESEVQTGGVDGRFLVFSSYGQLTADDTDTAKDVYRYDAVTGELVRVSVGEEGAEANGTGNGFNATIAFDHPGGPVFEQDEMNSRAISEDGSRIVFRSAGPLSESANNGLVNVYEWRDDPGWSEGRVSMISCGCSTESDEQVVISSSGRDVFFTTAAGLVPQDTDGAVDIYDAHECSQSAPCFSSSPVEPEPCEGEGCYGPLTSPTPQLQPASTTQPASTPKPTPTQKTTTKKKKTKLDRKRASSRRKKVRKMSERHGSRKRTSVSYSTNSRGER